MRTQYSDFRNISHHHPNLGYGDGQILARIGRSKFLGLLLSKPLEALIVLLKGLIPFLIALVANVNAAIYRRNHGTLQVGFLSSIFSAFAIASYNSIHLSDWSKPLMVFAAPVRFFTNSKEELYRFFFVDVESNLLLSLMVVTLVFSVFNALTSYMNSELRGSAKPGDSLLHKWFFSKLKIGAGFVKAIIEPGITALIGFVVLTQLQDEYGGMFLIIVAGADMISQALTASKSSQKKAILGL